MPDPNKIVDALNWVFANAPGPSFESAALQGMQQPPVQQAPEERLKSGLLELAPAAIPGIGLGAKKLVSPAMKLLRGGEPAVDQGRRNFLKVSAALGGAAALKPLAQSADIVATATEKVAKLGIRKLPEGWSFNVDILPGWLRTAKEMETGIGRTGSRYEVQLHDDVGNPIETISQGYESLDDAFAAANKINKHYGLAELSGAE